MSLKELLGNLEETVEIKGVTIKVKPLSLSNIGELLETNKEDLGRLFNGAIGFQEILAEMPDLTYKVIAFSTGEDYKEIALLPIGIQLLLLEKIVDASQISSDAMGKLVNRLVRGVQTILPEDSTLTSGKTVSKEHLDKSLEKAIASEK